MSAADRLRKEGENRGEARGVEKTALGLLEQDIDIEIISKATKLSVGKIKSLQAQNQAGLGSEKKQ